ncbi:MAG TPA: amidohydrolase [Candidatus Eremiobacteraceae bacterium]|nr:amidohydrolase [Candidatus Eremiobacteraceae bacterium]
MSDPLAAVAERVIGWRREIHRQPELGFNEQRTSELVESELEKAGIATQRVAGTGIIGLVQGALPGKTVALRADMDALPLQERSGEPFASLIPNVMHACGHDAHTAMLLGAATLVAQERASLRGAVKFLFQPAEEGPGGAKPMIEAGALQNPDVAAAAMLHVTPLLPAGVVGVRSGPMNASADDFNVRVFGRGGHGAHPHIALDVIPVAAEIVSALQRIRSREIDPLESVVISIGVLQAGYRRNIIADRAELGGTIRCLNESVRESIPQRIERIVSGICAAHGVRCEVNVERGYPAVINDPALTAAVRTIARSTAAIPGVIELTVPSMGAEDFAYFAQAVPGCMARLGVGFADVSEPAMLHSPEFRLNENALISGVAFLRALATRLPSEL